MASSFILRGLNFRWMCFSRFCCFLDTNHFW